MSDFSRALDRGPRRHAGRPRLGRGAPGLEPRRRPAPERGRLRRERRRRRQGRSASPAENGLRVAGQGTGHGAVALGSLDDAILIKTERMRGVEVDADAPDRAGRGRRARRSSWARRQTRHGLARCPGSSPDVGVVGYTLGGGLSWLGRRYGFACNRVTRDRAGHRRRRAADGRRRERPRPLLGAARRRRRLRDRHRPAPRRCSRSPRSTPAPCSSRPRSAPRRSAPTATGRQTVPDEVTSVVRFLDPPPIPDVPEPLRGTPLLTIDGACIGSQAEGEADRSRRCARSASRSWTPSTRSRPPASAASTWTPSSRCPASAITR